MNEYDIVVIGAGPAGMMAAGTAAQMGCRVLVLDKNQMTGRKLRITGKGRCNLTNASDLETVFANIPVNPRFLYSSLYQFDNASVMDFFEGLGVKLKTERGNRVFPQSDRAQDVALALEKFLRQNKGTFLKGQVTGILTRQGAVCGVKTRSGTIGAKKVLIATGGLSYPLTGSTGDGYRFAQELGHRVTPLRPSLVPVVCAQPWVKELQGLSLKNIEITLLDGNNKECYREFGEMLFTHFGVSGPVILSASAHIKPGQNYRIEIDLKPALTEEVLDKRLLRDFEKFHSKQFINSLGELLPKKLIPVVAALSGIPREKQVNHITKQERHALCRVLKHLTVTVTGLRPVAEAIVTSGGICVKEVNPSTMESKLVPGLYFAGEVLDVDAYTGGFNLQIAFSTGHLAGVSMAEKLEQEGEKSK